MHTQTAPLAPATQIVTDASPLADLLAKPVTRTVATVAVTAVAVPTNTVRPEPVTDAQRKFIGVLRSKCRTMGLHELADRKVLPHKVLCIGYISEMVVATGTMARRKPARRVTPKPAVVTPKPVAVVAQRVAPKPVARRSCGM